MTKINGAGTRHPGLAVAVEFHVSPMMLIAAVAEHVHDFCTWHGIDLNHLDPAHANTAFAALERRHVIGSLAAKFNKSGANLTWAAPAHRCLFDTSKAIASRLFPEMFPVTNNAKESHRHSA